MIGEQINKFSNYTINTSILLQVLDISISEFKLQDWTKNPVSEVY